MASVLEYVINGQIAVETLISLLKKSDCTGQLSEKENIPELLRDCKNFHQEFIPFFLNYLRDQTLHLLQSSKSATPSPIKTPSAQKLKKAPSDKKASTNSKRVQLFGSSPGDGLDDIKATSGSLFSPNTSFESPSTHLKAPACSNSTEKDYRFKNNKCTPYGKSNSSSHNCGKSGNYDNRVKQRFTLGEFIVSPEVQSFHKKNSPYAGGRKGDKSNDSSPSPVHTCINHKNQGSKKRHSVDSVNRLSSSPAPVFSLNNTNEFPPVGSDGKPVTPRRCDLMVDKGDLTSIILRNSPNFDNTPRAVKTNPITKSRRISFTTLPQDGSGESCQVPSRRIKPTPVSGKSNRKQNVVFLEQAETNISNDDSTSTASCLSEERELLRKERAKRLQQKKEGTTECPHSPTVHTPTKFSLDRSSSTVEFVIADTSEVTHKQELDQLVQLYSACLLENLFPNMSMELYFLVQLMTSRSADLELVAVFGQDVIEQNYFSTVHNAVYFAISVLQSLKRLLSFFDKGTLRLMSENPRILHFSPTLSDWLTDIVTEKNQQIGPIYPKSPIGSVSFQAETDNRKNFPDDRTFHLFKRQRDGFYELLREWESHRLTAGWSVKEALGDRIRALVGFKTELSNHLHFARLFQSQLISMCKGDGSVMADTEDDNIALLNQLKRSNPEKFKRLQERFIKPLSFGGPCPDPSFPGCQEFFRDFIIAASSPIFNQHLCDTFASKISDLNSIDFTVVEDAGNEGSDDEQKELFVSSLVTLRLLGKFLGFVTFLPYHTSVKLPDDMEATYISLRKKHMPHVDLVECIKESYTLHRLTLTIPWVVEFLSMMDIIAPSIDHFQLTLYFLSYLHRYCWREITPDHYGYLLIVTMISWLLDDIPVEVATVFMSKRKTSTQHVHIDSMGFIDQSLYYSCCPYLLEMRTLLMEFAVGCSSKNSTIRKITPISADDSATPKASEKQIQLQLEENFFHNHPASLRRCVEFVAERTASNYIKKFRSSLLQKLLSDSKKALHQHLLSQAGGSPSGKAKDKLQHDILKIAQEYVSQVKVGIATQVGSYCEGKILALIPLLLPDEQSKLVIQTSMEISTRLSQEKVHLWINKHITVHMFQSELATELDKILKAQLLNQSKAQSDVSGADTSFEVIAADHSDEGRAPSDVMIDMKDIVKLILLKKQFPGRDCVKGILTETKHTLEKRQDILPGIFRSFGQVVIDLALSLLTYFPDQWEDIDIVDFTELWIGPLRNAIRFTTCMCSHVLQRLQISPNSQVAWKNYECFLLMLIQLNLLNTSDLQQSCLDLLIENQTCVERLAECLCHIVQHLQSNPQYSQEVELGEVLEWIYQICGRDCPISIYILQTLNLEDFPNVNIDENQCAIQQTTEQSISEKLSEDNCVKFKSLSMSQCDVQDVDKENLSSNIPQTESTPYLYSKDGCIPIEIS